MKVGISRFALFSTFIVAQAVLFVLVSRLAVWPALAVHAALLLTDRPGLSDFNAGMTAGLIAGAACTLISIGSFRLHGRCAALCFDAKGGR